MHIVQGGYATYFNTRHHRSGHLFQNRLKSVLVGEDSTGIFLQANYCRHKCGDVSATLTLSPSKGELLWSALVPTS